MCKYFRMSVLLFFHVLCLDSLSLPVLLPQAGVWKLRRTGSSYLLQCGQADVSQLWEVTVFDNNCWCLCVCVCVCLLLLYIFGVLVKCLIGSKTWASGLINGWVLDTFGTFDAWQKWKWWHFQFILWFSVKGFILKKWNPYGVVRNSSRNV